MTQGEEKTKALFTQLLESYLQTGISREARYSLRVSAAKHFLLVRHVLIDLLQVTHGMLYA